jgi:hypothetical protein
MSRPPPSCGFYGVGWEMKMLFLCVDFLHFPVLRSLLRVTGHFQFTRSQVHVRPGNLVRFADAHSSVGDTFGKVRAIL